MKKRQNLRMRDPFIFPYDGKYYMPAFHPKKAYTCVILYVSDDLENWEEVGDIYEIDQDGWAKEDVWAPELYLYNGKFYLFVSHMGKHGLRGTQVAICDSVDGKYLPLVNRPITPMDKSCIDATFIVTDGKPYIFYSRDWPNNYNKERDCFIGQIWGAEVSEDLKEIVGEPFLVFNADESDLTKDCPNHLHYFHADKFDVRYGSDGPFVKEMSNGALCLIWSPILDWNYVVLSAVSDNGNPRGPWRHINAPVFDNNGGHGMLFTDFDGSVKLTLHNNQYNQVVPVGLERTVIFETKETKDGYVITKEI